MEEVRARLLGWWNTLPLLLKILAGILLPGALAILVIAKSSSLLSSIIDNFIRKRVDKEAAELENSENSNKNSAGISQAIVDLLEKQKEEAIDNVDQQGSTEFHNSRKPK